MDFPVFQVNVAHPAWLFYASLLVLAVFLRFSRPISVRNLDIVLILSLSTALVLTSIWGGDKVVSESGTAGVDETLHQWSSIVLLSLSILLIVRLIFDESLTRRPRLGQNLNQAGLTFLCAPAFAILMTSVFVGEPPGGNVDAVESGKALLHRQAIGEMDSEADDEQPAPTETLIAAVAQLSGGIDDTAVSVDSESTPIEQTIACFLVVLAHTIVIAGLLYIGSKHFNSMQLGISMSCLYLLLPCTAFKVHELSHVLPAACLIWAVACYRRPAVAGILLGLACGTLFFAVFLLPLWAVFYGRRGSIKFGVSLAAVAALALFAVAMTSSTTDSFFARLVHTTNWTVYRLFTDQLPVSSMGVGQIFLRITLAAAFFVMLTAMTVIPRRRNLENLLANSTALVVAAQLWYPEDVGTYVLWYLPLLLLVMFRPRLDRFTPPETEVTKSAASQSCVSTGRRLAVSCDTISLAIRPRPGRPDSRGFQDVTTDFIRANAKTDRVSRRSRFAHSWLQTMSRTARSNPRRRITSQLIIVVIIVVAALLQPRIESWFQETFPETNYSGESGTGDLQQADSDRSLPNRESAASGRQDSGSEVAPSEPDKSVLVEVDDARFRKNTSGSPITITTDSQADNNRSGSRESGDEPPPGNLTPVGRNIFRSTAGLVYRPGSREGHRLKHILTHAKDNLDKPVHGVFVGDREEILRWIDLAFIKAGRRGSEVRKRQEDQRIEWTVNMKEEIGYVGGYKGRLKACRYLRLVIEDDGETVVTAYPTSSF